MNLYHTTECKNIASIKEHGLLRNKSTSWKGAGGCIYLATQPFQCQTGMVVILVHCDGLEITKISDWEYAAWEDIEPDRLRVVGTGWVRCGL